MKDPTTIIILIATVLSFATTNISVSARIDSDNFTSNRNGGGNIGNGGTNNSGGDNAGGNGNGNPNDKNGGRRVGQLGYATQGGCISPPPCISIQVDVFTDKWAYETSWTLTNTVTGDEVWTVENGRYGDQYTQYTDTKSFEPSEYTFEIRDAWGDGICCSAGEGNYEVMYDGEVVASGGEFGRSTRTTFGGRCGPPPIQVQVDVLTDKWPGETSWTLTNTVTGDEVWTVERGRYSDQYTQYTDTKSFEPGEYTFEIRDAWGDGICCSEGEGQYEVMYDGEVVASGGEFERSTRMTFRGSCNA